MVRAGSLGILEKTASGFGTGANIPKPL